MRIHQIKNLLAIRNNYHPLLSSIFRNNENKFFILFTLIITILSFLIVICALFFILLLFFQQKDINILLSSSELVFLSSFLLTLKSAYNYLYSGADQNLLKVLPVQRNEIVLANIIHFYLNQLLISLFIFSAAFFANKSSNITFIAIGVFLLVIIPFIAILFSIFLSSFIYYIKTSIKRKSQVKCLSFHKKSTIFSLTIVEYKCLFQFSSLILEIISFVFLYTCIFFLAINRNYKFIGIMLLFPSISMINISSFSREGAYHNNLESFPISDTIRIFSKILFFFVLYFPLHSFYYLLAFFNLHNIIILLALIPSSILFINTALINLAYDRKTIKIGWTNPQEAIQLNIPILLNGLFLGTITAIFLFSPDLFFITPSVGLIFSILLNLSFFFIQFRRIEH